MTTDPNRIRELYTSMLKPRLDAMESLRRSVFTNLLKSAAIVGVPLLGVIGFGQLLFGDSFAVSAAGFAFTIAAALFVIFRYAIPGLTAHANYKTRFKRAVAAEVFTALLPDARYEPFKGISRQAVIDSGLFKDRGGFGSDDRVRGLVAGTPFEAAEVSRRYRTGRKNTDTTITVFHGLFMRLATEAGVSGPVIVEPESPDRVQLGDRSGLVPAALDDPEFAREFKVYAASEIDARRVLSPAMRNGLLAVRRQAQHPLFVAFHKDRVYVAVNYGRALFEPAVAATTSAEAIEEIANHFGVAELVVRELELQSRGGERAVAAPMWEPDVETAQSRLTDRLTSGSLTEAQLLEVGFALDGTSYDTKHEEAVSRPADSQVEIRNDGRGVTISYGLPLSYFLVIAISLVAALVATAAARTVAQTTSLGPLTSFAARVPEMTRLDELIAHFPLVWMIGGLLVWAALTFWWLQRVRRVDIEADAVKIYRGLRPLPRTYSRPPYGKVVRIDNCVFVGKIDSVTPLNPSASPVLGSEQEARWVAAEMRRALR